MARSSNICQLCDKAEDKGKHRLTDVPPSLRRLCSTRGCGELADQFCDHEDGKKTLMCSEGHRQVVRT